MVTGTVNVEQVYGAAVEAFRYGNGYVGREEASAGQTRIARRALAENAVMASSDAFRALQPPTKRNPVTGQPYLTWRDAFEDECG
jgi:hypothetical protein